MFKSDICVHEFMDYMLDYIGALQFAGILMISHMDRLWFYYYTYFEVQATMCNFNVWNSF